MDLLLQKNEKWFVPLGSMSYNVVMAIRNGCLWLSTTSRTSGCFDQNGWVKRHDYVILILLGN